MKFFKWNWMVIIFMVVIVGFVTMGILQKENLTGQIEERDVKINGLEKKVESSERKVLDQEEEIQELKSDAVKRDEEIAKGEERIAKVETEKWVLKRRMVRIPPTEVMAKTVAEIACDGIRMFRLDGEDSVVFSEECAEVNLGYLENFSLAKKDIERLTGEKDKCLGEVAELKKIIEEKDGIIGERDLQIEGIRKIVLETEGDLSFAILDGKVKARKKFLQGTAVGAVVVLGISLLVGK